MLSVHFFEFNPFAENTYVIFDDSGNAAIIDAGCHGREEEKILEEFIAKKNLRPKLLLNTHSHIDHILGADFVKRRYNVPLLIYPKDESTLRSGSVVSAMYGIGKFDDVTFDGYIGEEVTVGKEKLKVLFVPGHAPGHVAFYHEPQGIVIGGDVLFNRSIGRTDLPGGNFDTLIESIHQQLFVLPGSVVVYPGHGPSTTIGEEKVHNPFCALSLK
jgi:glyoxylase-like metal-dependent hydrolase (beta-lactamase superfamily II)